MKMDLHMRIIALGTGESCDHHSTKLNNLAPDIEKIAFHRAFMLLKERGVDVDYWTWTDPDAAESGLKWMVANPTEKHPKIILPYWSRSESDISKFYPIASNLKFTGRIKEHFRLLNSESVKKNITFLDNAINYVKQSSLVTDSRFSGSQIVFHTPNRKTGNGGQGYGAENVFTRHLLPICHYLGANEVYNLGLDNQGLGFNRGVSQWKGQSHEVNESLGYFKQWMEWDKEHNMKIYRCMEDKFTNIGDIVPYKPLEDLYE